MRASQGGVFGGNPAGVGKNRQKDSGSGGVEEILGFIGLMVMEQPRSKKSLDTGVQWIIHDLRPEVHGAF